MARSWQTVRSLWTWSNTELELVFCLLQSSNRHVISPRGLSSDDIPSSLFEIPHCCKRTQFRLSVVWDKSWILYLLRPSVLWRLSNETLSTHSLWYLYTSSIRWWRRKIVKWNFANTLFVLSVHKQYNMVKQKDCQVKLPTHCLCSLYTSSIRWWRRKIVKWNFVNILFVICTQAVKDGEAERLSSETLLTHRLCYLYTSSIRWWSRLSGETLTTHCLLSVHKQYKMVKETSDSIRAGSQRGICRILFGNWPPRPGLRLDQVTVFQHDNAAAWFVV